ncbi:hypothetical protein [Saccharopolyspora taberi]|uniref:Uncharacterized protein n=1 Tax=Saccharopolyspora taberi TaxID=60895 RepID=A0ABN3V4W7_9PSEU
MVEPHPADVTITIPGGVVEALAAAYAAYKEALESASSRRPRRTSGRVALWRALAAAEDDLGQALKQTAVHIQLRLVRDAVFRDGTRFVHDARRRRAEAAEIEREAPDA